jgi:cysteine-rich repeat protein
MLHRGLLQHRQVSARLTVDCLVQRGHASLNGCAVGIYGNSVVEYVEECDDGNGDAADGCTNACTIWRWYRYDPRGMRRRQPHRRQRPYERFPSVDSRRDAIKTGAGAGHIPDTLAVTLSGNDAGDNADIGIRFIAQANDFDHTSWRSSTTIPDDQLFGTVLNNTLKLNGVEVPHGTSITPESSEISKGRE